jgi:hypothetical protein
MVVMRHFCVENAIHVLLLLSHRRVAANTGMKVFCILEHSTAVLSVSVCGGRDT